MAWIESHQKLVGDTKVFDLMTAMNWNKAEAIGRLHMFWWWCVDHAETGDLRRFNDSHIALAVELNSQDGKRFVESLVASGFIERKPYFRISNWWKFTKRFMKQKYKDNPSKWQLIESAYYSVTDTVTVTVPQETIPNLTKQKHGHFDGFHSEEDLKNTPPPVPQPPPLSDFDRFWESYPRKAAKEAAKKAFKKYDGNIEVVTQIMSGLELAKKNNAESWAKNSGQFIPHASTWLNQKRWEDEIANSNPKQSYWENVKIHPYATKYATKPVQDSGSNRTIGDNANCYSEPKPDGRED